MKWNHLPESGGLYDQNPQLLDRFYYIFAEKSRYESSEQAKRDRESGPASKTPSGRGRR